MIKPFLQKNSNDSIKPITDGGKGFILFLKGISPKVNVTT